MDVGAMDCGKTGFEAKKKVRPQTYKIFSVPQQHSYVLFIHRFQNMFRFIPNPSHTIISKH